MHGFRSRKGISEVIAVMMIIAITVAGAGLLYVYSQGSMGRLQTNVNQPYLEQVTLDYYDWTNSSLSKGTLKLTIRNVGTVPISFADFFIAGVRNTTSLTFTSCSLVGGMLSVQSSCTLTFRNLTGFTSGTAYAVKIVTKDGAIFTYSCVAGSLTH